MFRIRRIYDDLLPANRDALTQVKAILRAQFSALSEEEIEALGENLRDPFHRRFSTVLYVAEQGRKGVLGFALVMRDPALAFWFLEYIATRPDQPSQGVGGALYERLREEAISAEVKGLFFECLPDDEAQVHSPEELEQNRARLRFYERYGARPIVGTDYETPLTPGELGAPYLVYDPLGSTGAVSAPFLKKVVRAILERKYKSLCPPEYNERVLASFTAARVRIRPPRYLDAGDPPRPKADGADIPLVVNDRHSIHHVRERGYVESPVRIGQILTQLSSSQLFEPIKAKSHGLAPILKVHDRDFVEYLKRVCATIPEGKSVYPYVFPLRNAARPPKELSVRAGYYCIDTFTPLNKNAFLAARGAVDCALTAAAAITSGAHLAYALVRPPGHHAERRSFGGFCYFNNVAIAAEALSELGKVAILDIDYHHGNGQQDIFYRRDDVLTVSLHGHPSFAYPYFSGFEDERGEGVGEGFNLNLPLGERTQPKAYRRALSVALDAVSSFAPTTLVLALGLDTAKGDPTGTWFHTSDDFRAIGRDVGALGASTLVVQEGGYRTRTLGRNARSFFVGLVEGARQA